MATRFKRVVPIWFWIVAILAVAWEVIGCIAYLGQVSMTPADLAALPEGQRILFSTMPIWVTGAYGIATWGGLVAAILLLLRVQWATLLFGISLVALLVQFGWAFLIAGAARLVGPSAYGLPAAIIVVGIALVWFSSMTNKRGWLR